MTPEELGRQFSAIMDHRDKHGGRHLHHRNCVHNLPPEEQVAMRGNTVEWWTTVIGPLPEQITPDQWECEPPITAM